MPAHLPDHPLEHSCARRLLCVAPRGQINIHGDQAIHAIYNYGYACQTAHYLEGAAVHWPGTFDLFVFVVVENESPQEVVVYELDARALELARAEHGVLRVRYAACIATNTWPGYNTEVTRIGLPPLAEARMRGNGRTSAA